jgi:hypothetical protein
MKTTGGTDCFLQLKIFFLTLERKGRMSARSGAYTKASQTRHSLCNLLNA